MAQLIIKETNVLAPTGTGTFILTPAKLVYDSRDPWAVGVHINVGEAWVKWTFSRELLDIGMFADREDPEGEGDVQIWSCDSDDVHVLLSNPNGRCELEFDGEDVEDFLLSTYDAVPLGSERQDVDAVIAALLGGTP